MKRVISLWIILVLGLTLWGQSTQTGSISGTLTDDKGVELPGATVTLSGERIFADRTAVSNVNGSFHFRNVPVGAYELTVNMPGFNTVKEKLTAALGVNVRLQYQLVPQQSLSETITVVATEPLIDTTSVQQGENFTADEMKELPTSRDPWAIINTVAGINMSQTNVGGSKAGTQARFAAPGVNQYQNAYYIDGVNTTDTAATGASSQYYNFDRFQEMQVSTGGHDPSIQAGGVIVNLVSRSGSNKFEGYVNAFYQNESMQGDNPIYLDGEDQQFGNPSNYNKDYSFGLSGPIIKDRVWFSLGYHVNEIENYINQAKEDVDYTELEQYNMKLQFALNANQTFTISYAHDEKAKPNRAGSTTRGPLATWNQTGPGKKWNLGYEWFINTDMILEAKVGISEAPFSLGPQSGVNLDEMAVYDRNIPLGGDANGVYRWTNGYGYYYDYARDRNQYGVKLTYFNEGLFNASHTFTIGADVAESENYAEQRMKGGVVQYIFEPALVDRFGVDGQVWLARDAQSTEYIDTTAFYINDSVVAGNWTLNLGFRYDIQKGSIAAGNAAAPSWWRSDWEHAAIFQEVSSEALNDVVTWKNLEPRVSAIYDIAGQGTDSIKVSYAKYAYVLDSATFDVASAIGFAEIDYSWIDSNGDGQWQLDETVTDQIWYSEGTSVGGTPIDDDLFAPEIDEFMLTYEKLFHVSDQQLALSASYIYKTNSNDVYIRDRNRHISNWSLGSVDVELPDGSNQTLDNIYTFSGDSVPDDIVTNYKSYESKYNGAMLSLHKPFGQSNWMAMLSSSYNDYSGSWDPAELNDPNSRWSAKNSDGAGRYASRYNFKLNAAYKLPWDLLVSTFARYDSGELFESNAEILTGGVSSLLTLSKDSEPSLFQLDIGIQKKIRFGNHEITARIDGFNVTNEDTIIAYESTEVTDGTDYLRPSEIIGPRIFRVGVSYAF